MRISSIELNTQHGRISQAKGWEKEASLFTVIKRIHAVWFHWYEIQNQAELINGITGQDGGSSWEVGGGGGSREPEVLFLGLGVSYPDVSSLWELTELDLLIEAYALEVL